MEVREKRTCSVFNSPAGTGNSLSGFSVWRGRVGGRLVGFGERAAVLLDDLPLADNFFVQKSICFRNLRKIAKFLRIKLCKGEKHFLH